MENLGPVVLEISSDEESGFGDTVGGGFYWGSTGGEGSGGGNDDDHDWLSRLLVEVGKEDDSDDVVVVGEVIPKAPRKSKTVVDDDDDDDDDCVVLECDPDKPVLLENSRVEDDGGDDSDDLAIVGEKGEVACRDFPHSRHCCVKYLFSSTPHTVHCVQCHCYVCDSIAPCAHWGTGVSSLDHCHASDKEEYWRQERKNKKNGDKPLRPTLPTSNTSTLKILWQTTTAPPLPNSVQSNQRSRPVTMHPSSVSCNVSVPAGVNLGGGHPLACKMPIYTPHSQLVSTGVHSTYNNNVTSRVKSYNAGNRISHFSPSRTLFKRSGITTLPLNRCHELQPRVLNGQHVPNQQNVNSHLPVRTRMDIRIANSKASQPRTHSLPISSRLVRAPMTMQRQMPPPPYTSSNFLNEVPFEPRVAAQPSIGSFESIIPSHSNSTIFVGSDQLQARSVTPSYQNMGNMTENQSSQPHGYNQTSSLLINGKNDFQQGTESGLGPSSVDFDFDWDVSLSHLDVQPPTAVSQLQNAAPADNFQNERVSIDDDQNVAQVHNMHQQSLATTDNSSVLDHTVLPFPEITNPDILKFSFNDWMFEDPSLPGMFCDPVSPHWNVSSPDPASVDVGTILDI